MFPSKSDKRKKRNKGGGRIKLAVALLLLVAIAGGAAYFIFFRSDTSVLAGQRLRISSDAQIVAASDSIYYYSENKLSCVDYTDTLKWTLDTENADLELAASDSMVALSNTNRLWLFSFDGTAVFPEPITFSGTIEGVRCGVATVMILYNDTEGILNVDTIGLDGERKRQLKFEDSYVIDFGFSTGDSSYIYTIDLDSVIPVARVSTANEQQADTGNIPVQGQVLWGVVFRQDGMYAVGTNQIMKYDYTGALKSSHLIYGWRYVDNVLVDEDGVCILLVPGGDTATESFISTARLHIPDQPDVSIQLEAGTKQVVLGSSRVYSFTLNKMTVYDFDGNRLGEYPSNYGEATINRVIKAPDVGKTTRALVVTNEGVYSARLP